MIHRVGAGCVCLFVAAISGCGGGGSGASSAPQPPPPPVAAKINALTAAPNTINAGEMAALDWSTSGATACIASGGWLGSEPLAGPMTVGPLSATSTFTLTCDAGSSDTRASASVTVTVVPPPAPATYALNSAAGEFNDVLWDPNQQVMYVAIGSTAGFNPNTITAFDPVTGTVLKSVFAGSEPRTLAISDDGHYLYVGLAGANLVRRFVLPALTADIDIPTDPDSRSSGSVPQFARRIVVAPGAPDTIAVTRFSPESAFTLQALTGGLFMVFDGVNARTFDIGSGLVANDDYALAWGATAATLYGGSLSSDQTQALLDVFSTANSTFSGVSRVSSTALGIFPGGLENNNGLGYDDLGNVIDLATSSVVDRYPNAHGVAIPDPVNHRVFYADVDPVSGRFTLQSYNLESHQPLGSVDFGGGAGVIPVPIFRAIRWGTDGIAVSFFDGTLRLISGSFVAPGGATPPGNAIPTGTKDVVQFLTLTPQTLATPANDIAFDSGRGRLYASVPNSASSGANSIAVIDPVTGNATSYVPTGIAPGPLAMSDDGQYLYVGGANVVQRYKASDLSLDLSFAVPGTAIQLTVAPGAPHTIAVQTDVAPYFYTDGTQLGFSNGTCVQWGADANTAYTIDSAGTPTELRVISLTGGTVQTVYSLLDEFSAVYPRPFNMKFNVAGGLLYGGTGMIFDPATRGLVGTLPLTGDSNRDSLNGGYRVNDLGVSTLDAKANRVFVAVSTVFSRLGVFGPPNVTFTSFDATTFVPKVTAPLTGSVGPAVELLQIAPTSFAVLYPNGQIVLISDPALAQ